MESLPLATPIPQNNNSMKRLNADSLMDAEVAEVLPTTPRSSKSQKIKDEVLYDEVIIDVDSNEDSTDVAVISTEEVDKAMKGKAIIDVFYGGLNGLAEGCDDLCDDDDDYNDDDDGDDYMDYLLEDDDKGGSAGYDHLQSQFDNIDLPTGVETSVPWLPDTSKSEKKSEGGPNSIYPPPPTMKDKKGRAITVLDSQNVHIVDTMLRYEHFRRFDTVEDFSDHHYHKENSSAPPKHWAKRIQEEWKILEKDLPETIFVRVYEERMDLLRAVILGAEGTPYHDGIFFFDVLFPTNYPDSPPKVYYHSGGLRLNPNLYENGYVCLSLLNTWQGDPTEKWQPQLSTMLQVLVSIQGLILNEKPYFNEPGYANSSGTVDGEKRSLNYNERTFVLSLKTMSYTMRRPPKCFEELAKGHFLTHAEDILGMCRAYLDGAQVGSLKGGVKQEVDADGNKIGCCSQQFKRNLSSYVPILAKDFTNLGIKDIERFLPPPPSSSSSSSSSDAPSTPEEDPMDHYYYYPLY